MVGILGLAEEHTVLALAGCALAVCGNVLYFAARLKLLESQQLPKEAENPDRTEEHAGVPHVKSVATPPPAAPLPASKANPQGKLIDGAGKALRLTS